MNASSLLSAHEWAQQTFGAVLLGDQRRVERALVMAEAIAHDTGASLPSQMHNEADLHAAYRFLQNPQVSYERLIRPHLAQTRAAMGKPERVLLIQDTTEVDYQPHPTTTGLGPIGNGSHHGFLLQTVLAVEASRQQVLGIAHQEPFLRQPAPQGESKRQRELRERESQVWQRSVEALGPPPEGEQWIHIGDRYSDMYSFLWSCRQQQCDFVVRAAQDRCVDLLVEQADKPLPARSHHKASAQQPPKPKTPHLLEVVDSWAARGEQEVVLDGSQQRKGRVAHVQLSWGSVRLLPPRSQQAAGLRPLVVWVVHVWEAEPPEGVEPLEWLLLTSVPTESFEQAC